MGDDCGTLVVLGLGHEFDSFLEGEWVKSTGVKPFVGNGYIHDDNKNKGG